MQYKLRGIKVNKTDDNYIEKRKKYIWLMRTIIGYTSQEAIQKFDDGIWHIIAKNLTYKDVCLVLKPFIEHDCWLNVYDEDDNEININTFNIIFEEPKIKYYDSPILSINNHWTHQDENFYLTKKTNEKLIETALKCPFCKSTNVKKIGVVNRSASIGLFGLASSKIGKQWQCNSCKSAF